MCWCSPGQYRAAVSVSPKRDARSDYASRFCNAIVRARNDPNGIAHVCYPQCFHRCAREGNYSRHRSRGCDRFGGIVRRANLWCVNESCTLAGTGSDFRQYADGLDLSCRSSSWRFARSARLHLRARERLLLSKRLKPTTHISQKFSFWPLSHKRNSKGFDRRNRGAAVSSHDQTP